MRCPLSVLRSHLWFGALYPHKLLYKLLQALEDCRWLQPSGVVGIDIGELHRTLTPNHERPRHRKLPRFIPVIDPQINAPDVRVKLPQSCCQGEDEAELPRHAIAFIAQHLELQRVLLRHRQRLVRPLRRDGDELGAKRANLRQSLLIGPQLQVAIRSPDSTVEGYDHRTAHEEVRKNY